MGKHDHEDARHGDQNRQHEPQDGEEAGKLPGTMRELRPPEGFDGRAALPQDFRVVPISDVVHPTECGPQYADCDDEAAREDVRAAEAIACH